MTPAVDDIETICPELRSINSGRNSNSVQNCEYTFTSNTFWMSEGECFRNGLLEKFIKLYTHVYGRILVLSRGSLHDVLFYGNFGFALINCHRLNNLKTIRIALIQSMEGAPCFET